MHTNVRSSHTSQTSHVMSMVERARLDAKRGVPTRLGQRYLDLYVINYLRFHRNTADTPVPGIATVHFHD